ncbi:MAG: tRNA preQ1(34) S-adenosylmethionine ribosyltransferase-isomerase QueA [Planctomycetaceae bacterium]|nr:tRNA preQ1(34) S-adenosylmethionine ribosyltransferase-isomerase QueA [Planctomycetaceae bacterium]
MDQLSLYDYELPPERIASKPARHRTDARLMVIDRSSGTWEHKRVSDLPGYLSSKDALVINNTRVLRARLLGKRLQTGGQWEGLFLHLNNDGSWRMLAKTKGRIQVGEKVVVSPAHDPDSEERLILTLTDKGESGEWSAMPDRDESHIELLEQFGTMPLPPYMRKKLATDRDFRRYQTTFAERPGSVAAPTAGLHFTRELFDEIESAGVTVSHVTLHIGIGTFRPISVENLDQHVMHSEWCELTSDTASHLNQRRADGGRLIAVGTTSVRTLESATKTGTIEPFEGETDLFIRPPYQFQAVDVLMTNFHLPKSSLLVMVSAFAGRELILDAYRDAIKQKYRFYSYGDAMLIV